MFLLPGQKGKEPEGVEHDDDYGPVSKRDVGWITVLSMELEMLVWTAAAYNGLARWLTGKEDDLVLLRDL